MGRGTDVFDASVFAPQAQAPGVQSATCGLESGPTGLPPHEWLSGDVSAGTISLPSNQLTSE